MESINKIEVGKRYILVNTNGDFGDGDAIYPYIGKKCTVITKSTDQTTESGTDEISYIVMFEDGFTCGELCANELLPEPEQATIATVAADNRIELGKCYIFKNVGRTYYADPALSLRIGQKCAVIDIDKSWPVADGRYMVRFEDGVELAVRGNELAPAYDVQVTYSVKVTDEDLDQIMSSALESGILYWCDKAEVCENRYFGEFAHEQISRGGSLRLHDAERDINHVLKLSDVKKGIALYLANYKASNVITPDIRDYETGGLNMYNIDATVADMVVQYALFGDVIYG